MNFWFCIGKPEFDYMSTLKNLFIAILEVYFQLLTYLFINNQGTEKKMQLRVIFYSWGKKKWIKYFTVPVTL